MKRVWLPGLAGLVALAFAAGTSFAADQPTKNNADANKASATTSDAGTAKDATKSDASKSDTDKGTKRHRHSRRTANKPVAPQGTGTAMTPAAATQHAAAKSHLPANFAKMNLTPEQHQKVLAVADRYASEIKQLESQIHALRAKRDGELNALLTDTQKKTLADAQTAAKTNRAQKKADNKAQKSMAMRKGLSFKVDPEGLKKLHDEAMKNINSGVPTSHRAKKAKTDESKNDESKKPASSSSQPAASTTTPAEKK